MLEILKAVKVRFPLCTPSV